MGSARAFAVASAVALCVSCGTAATGPSSSNLDEGRADAPSTSISAAAEITTTTSTAPLAATPSSTASSRGSAPTSTVRRVTPAPTSRPPTSSKSPPTTSPTRSTTPRKATRINGPSAFLLVGVDVAAGRYVGRGTECSYHLNGPKYAWYRDKTVRGDQVVVDLRDGEFIRTSCTLTAGSGESGRSRGSGIQVDVPAGVYRTRAACPGVFAGAELTRAGTAPLLPPLDESATLFEIPAGTVFIDSSCGGIDPA